MIRRRMLPILFVVLISGLLNGGEGRFINPLTEICWECLFPITISGVNVTPGHNDQNEHKRATCVCAGVPPKVGMPLSFWEPTRLVDVTRHPYKLLGLGGISIGKESIKNRGSVGIVGDGPSQSSFYHVHYYVYPLLSWLGILQDLFCVEKGDLDLAYMSELDPQWNDDNLALILSPEAAFFSQPVAQVACAADCLATSANKASDRLFWCAGCQGSLYPFTGTVAHHTSPLQASSLLLHRVIAKLHREHVIKGFDDDNFCEARYMPIIKRSIYKTQIAYPVPQTKGVCHPLGKSDLLWGAGKSYPSGGEDFVYVIWTKKQCCLDAVKTAVAGGL